MDRRKISTVIGIFLFLGISGWLVIELNRSANHESRTRTNSAPLVENQTHLVGPQIRSHSIASSGLGAPRGQNPHIPIDIQKQLFEYVQEASSVKIHSPFLDNHTATVSQNEMQELLGQLKYELIEDQGDNCEHIGDCLRFLLPNGNEAVVHIIHDGWQFTGGPRRKCADGLPKMIDKIKNRQRDRRQDTDSSRD